MMTSRTDRMVPLGAAITDTGTVFRLWSSEAASAAVIFCDDSGDPVGVPLSMKPLGDGFFEVLAPDVGQGALYKFSLDDRVLPDPYARFLPYGVHGPARVESDDFDWVHPTPPSLDLGRQVIYEIHIGTFTTEGTYAAARAKLPELAALGITTLELMPLSSFPGAHGWGYDGVAHFAPFAGYGTPDELRKLIDEVHGLGMRVILDVVYNHFGPSGNYLSAYSPRYFTKEAPTPWGEAPHFGEAPMRNYVLANAKYWLEGFKFDGLRLDATHTIFDPSEVHIVREIRAQVAQMHEQKILVAEDDRNDPEALAKMGVDAVWADDFHHALHVCLTQERDGYYSGYEGTVAELARVIADGWLYRGQVFPPSGQERGKPAHDLDAQVFVYCLQNHDQVGNRPRGSRLHHHVALDAYLAASALLLFLPMTPLLFMGQEWGASSPFAYFTDHEAELGALVSAGRRREFAGFEGFSGAQAQAVLDPQAGETFSTSRLDWTERQLEPHARILSAYEALLRLRRDDEVLGTSGRRSELKASAHDELLVVRRGSSTAGRLLIVNFSSESASIAAVVSGGLGRLLFSTSTLQDADPASGAAPVPGAQAKLAPRSAAIFEHWSAF